MRRVLEIAPHNTLALNNLATLLAERPNQRAEALQLIERAIDSAGRQPIAVGYTRHNSAPNGRRCPGRRLFGRGDRWRRKPIHVITSIWRPPIIRRVRKRKPSGALKQRVVWV